MQLFFGVSEQQANLWDEEDTKRDHCNEQNAATQQRITHGQVINQEYDHDEYHYETKVVHLNNLISTS
jgi:hypothetical protein